MLAMDVVSLGDVTESSCSPRRRREVEVLSSNDDRGGDCSVSVRCCHWVILVIPGQGIDDVVVEREILVAVAAVDAAAVLPQPLKSTMQLQLGNA